MKCEQLNGSTVTDCRAVCVQCRPTKRGGYLVDPKDEKSAEAPSTGSKSAAAPLADTRWSSSGSGRRLAAITRKEFIQLARDRRTVALMVGMPLVLLIIFGYGIRLSVGNIVAELVGHDSPAVRVALGEQNHFKVLPTVAKSESAARKDLLDGRTSVAVIVGATGLPTSVLVDGSNAFVAQNSLDYLRSLTGSSAVQPVNVQVLYNPTLRSADFMVPSEVGMIMLWVGTVATAIGVVREREQGTLEQLMMTPIRKLELMLGKILPYSALTLVIAVVITILGLLLFQVPLRGNPLELLLFAVPYLVSALSIGLLVSTIAQNQRQAMQTTTFILLPQILLSGALFPLAAIPWGIRWVSQLLPLTYFTPISRDIFLKGLGFSELWPQVAVLCGMAVIFTSLATIFFKTRLD
ncbi:MAG: ABC transporter permease [Candidatus Marsarchaeota archaeon]|nr:ABC transporter permease [Candidatus Marsarchaeota archaeon]